MHKVLVFDLDGTLAPVGKRMLDADIQRLEKLEKAGYRVAICSGKPSYYLCGFMRQVGLKNPLLIGENGGVFQFGVELPPVKYYEYPHSADAKKQLKQLKELIDGKCSGRVWYQPNEIGLTPFPKDSNTFEEIQNIVDMQKENIGELLVYRHIDSFDFTPKNVNKYNGLKYLADIEGLTQKDFIAIGDGVNDVPMFEFADISIGIGNKHNYPVTYRFDGISEALEYLVRENL